MTLKEAIREKCEELRDTLYGDTYAEGRNDALDTILSFVENYPDEGAVNSQPCKITDSDGNDIEKCVACGAEISPHNFELADTCIGEEYQVQILKCKNCGMLSFGWHKAAE